MILTPEDTEVLRAFAALTDLGRGKTYAAMRDLAKRTLNELEKESAPGSGPVCDAAALVAVYASRMADVSIPQKTTHLLLSALGERCFELGGVPQFEAIEKRMRELEERATQLEQQFLPSTEIEYDRTPPFDSTTLDATLDELCGTGEDT